jgi:phospholipid transport system substrate-binding protein
MLYFRDDRKSRYETTMLIFFPEDALRLLRTMAPALLIASLSAAALPLHAAGSCEGASREDALALVRETTSALFAALEAEDGVLISEDPARARALVEEFITPHVDLKGFSKLVLGKHWRRATPEQRQQFLKQFHTLILRTYATAVTTYTGIEVRYMPMREESRPNFATVRTVIPRADGEGVKVNYRLHCRNNVWKLFDVSIAGVSMVTTYRSAFSAEVKRSGLDGLIKALQQKNHDVGA